MYYEHVYILIFRAKSIGSIFRILGYHIHGAGGLVEKGEGGFHHVGGGVVKFI